MKKRKTEKSFPMVVEQDKRKLFYTTIQNNLDKFKAGVKTPTQEFLGNIKDEIRESLKNGVPYTILRKSIKDIFEVDISTSTLRAYAQKYLGVSKNMKKAEVMKKENILSVAKNGQMEENERSKPLINDI